MMSASELPESRKKILHISTRDELRPIRDEVLRLSGFQIQSTSSYEEGLNLVNKLRYDLVLVDVEGEDSVNSAERLCSEIKTRKHGPLVAFVCNWRVAVLTDCPDEILRTEFDPAAFVDGVRKTLLEV